jgi:hypothetical protein
MREHTTGPLLFLGDSPALVGVLLLHLQSSLVLPNSQLNTKVGSLVYSTALPGFPSPAATKSSSSSNPSKFLSKSNPLVPVVFESLTTTHQVIPVSPTPTIAITWKICSSYFDCFITTHQNVCSSFSVQLPIKQSKFVAIVVHPKTPAQVLLPAFPFPVGMVC